MTSRSTIIGAVIAIIVIGFFVNVAINLPSPNEKSDMFPGIIGDTVLKSNDTGIYVIKNMTLYDGFQGNIMQGYKANYSGINGTMIIFIAQMADNTSSYRSFKDMIIRNGYNYSIGENESVYNNTTVIKLPVANPEVFVMQKNNDAFHYVFVKSDKVYWVGFSKFDPEYQGNMLIETYINVDKKGTSGT